MGILPYISHCILERLEAGSYESINNKHHSENHLILQWTSIPITKSNFETPSSIFLPFILTSIIPQTILKFI